VNPADLKRQILMQSEQTGIRKKILSQHDTGITNDDVLEIGEALDKLTEQKGWTYIETYILKQADPIGLLFAEDNPVKKGEAKGLIKLMQYVDQMIKAKNELISKQRETDGVA